MSQYLDKDGASRIAENFLSKQTEQDAILKNLQFDLKEAEHALVKTIQGPAPLNIRALTRPLDDYLISGNTVQGGTPTPEAPVDVVGCGVRTGNLFDSSTIEVGGLDISTGAEVENSSRLRSGFIKVTPSTAYTLVRVLDVSNRSNLWVIGYDANKNVINDGTGSQSTIITSIGENSGLSSFVTTPLTEYIRWYVTANGSYSNIMLNLGSTPLPYEPYGYKLPLTVNGTEYPIYLGEAQTTRKIKKLVLTGEENWSVYTNITDCYRLDIRDNPGITGNGICSHYAKVATTSLLTDGTFVSGQNYSYFKDVSAQNLDGWKSYLAAQYAAGTPVTVWYVLATPETAVVNEPLHKIGNYADTINFAQAGVEISTTKGFNTITTDTTVLPSNIEVKGVINNA